MNDWAKTAAVVVFIIRMTDILLDKLLDGMSDEQIEQLQRWLNNQG